MEFQQRLAILKQIDLFQSLTDGELKRFAKAIIPVLSKDETVLFHEGDSGGEMYILVAGSLQIYKKNRRLTSIFPPDYVGEMSLIDDKPRSATVIAAPGSELFKITAQQFATFIESPLPMVSMVKTLSRRIRRDNELISAEFTKANVLIHDMRNTISAFLMLDLLEKSSTDEKQLKYLRLLQKGRRDLSEMLDEALANAKCLQFNKATKTNSLTELINELAVCDFTVHPDLTDKKIVLNVTDIPPFLFNSTDIRRVISNLVINAAQASKPKSSIQICLTSQNSLAKISISDQGSGIPANIQNKIFLPHFSTKAGGSGFGLTSCKQIIEEQHGGRLSFTSTTGQGCTFSFTIPITEQTVI